MIINFSNGEDFEGDDDQDKKENGPGEEDHDHKEFGEHYKEYIPC